MWLLYQLLLGILLLVSAPVFLLLRGRHYVPTLPGRLGRARSATIVPSTDGAAASEAPLWIHAVSVGEVVVARTLVAALPTSLPLLVTTVTPTGQERAREWFSQREGTAIAYLPFDLAPTLRPFLDRFRPRGLVLVEGEMWPYLLELGRRRDLAVVMINGRISDRSFARLARLRRLCPPLVGALLDPISRFGMQSRQDAERVADLGVEACRIVRTGNLKFESPAPPRHPPLEARLRELAEGRAILLAGSTMRGEEEAVLEAIARVGGERLLLALAPRHPERFDAVWQRIQERGSSAVRRSALSVAEPNDAPAGERVDVVLLDTLGELAGLYNIADFAFIGGTLVPTGGHNPLEAARFDVPIVVGPSMENFREIAELFDRQQAWQRVQDAAELAACLAGWIDDPAAAKEVGARGGELVEDNRGALAHTLRLIAPLCPEHLSPEHLNPEHLGPEHLDSEPTTRPQPDTRRGRS